MREERRKNIARWTCEGKTEEATLIGAGGTKDDGV